MFLTFHACAAIVKATLDARTEKVARPASNKDVDDIATEIHNKIMEMSSQSPMDDIFNVFKVAISNWERRAA